MMRGFYMPICTEIDNLPFCHAPSNLELATSQQLEKCGGVVKVSTIIM
jgi:hypothetical protein